MTHIRDLLKEKDIFFFLTENDKVEKNELSEDLKSLEKKYYELADEINDARERIKKMPNDTESNKAAIERYRVDIKKYEKERESVKDQLLALKSKIVS